MPANNTFSMHIPNPVRYAPNSRRCKIFHDADPFSGATQSEFIKLSDTAVFPGKNVLEFENTPRKGFRFEFCSAGVLCTHPALNGFTLTIPMSQWFKLFNAVGGFSEDTEFVVAERSSPSPLQRILVPVELVQHPEFASLFIAPPVYVEFDSLEQGVSYLQRYSQHNEWFIRTEGAQYLLGKSSVSKPCKGQAFVRQEQPALSNFEVESFQTLLRFFYEKGFSLEGVFDEVALNRAFYGIQGSPVTTKLTGNWVFNRNYTQDLNCWEALLAMPIWQKLTAAGPAPFIGTARLELIVEMSPNHMDIHGWIKGANNRVTNQYRPMGSDCSYAFDIPSGSILMLMDFLRNFTAVLEQQY